MDTRTKPATAENSTLSDRSAVSAATQSFRALDHAKEAMIARMTGGLSPASLRAALADWLIHLAAAPGKQLELASLCAQNAQRITEYMIRTALGCYAQPLAEPSAGDSRFVRRVMANRTLPVLATGLSVDRTMVERRNP